MKNKAKATITRRILGRLDRAAKNVKAGKVSAPINLATPNERWLYIRPRAKTENMMALTRDAVALVQKGLIDDPLAMPDDGGLVVLRADGSFFATYTKAEILSVCPDQREQL